MDCCLTEIKTEVEEEEVSFPGPPELKPFYCEDSTCSNLPTPKTEPLSTEQGEFYDEITVKEEELISEGEGEGQFVTEITEIFETESLSEHSSLIRNSKTQTTPTQIQSKTHNSNSRDKNRGYCLVCKEKYLDIHHHVSSVHKLQIMLKKNKTFKFKGETLTFKKNKCPICERKFMDRTNRNAWRHITNVHFIEKTSTINNSNISNKSNVKISPPKKKSATYKKCHLCKKHVINLNRHFLTVHKNTYDKDEIQKFIYRNKIFDVKNGVCPLCNHIFSTFHSVVRHIKLIHFHDRRYSGKKALKRNLKKTTALNSTQKKAVQERHRTLPKSRHSSPNFESQNGPQSTKNIIKGLVNEEINFPEKKICSEEVICLDTQQQSKDACKNRTRKNLAHKQSNHQKKSNGKNKKRKRKSSTADENIDTISYMLHSVNLKNDNQESIECLVNYKTDLNMYMSMCYICNQTFSYEYQLITHIKVMHLQDKKHTCEKCDTNTCWLYFLMQFLRSVCCKESNHECGDSFFPVIKWKSVTNVLKELGLYFCCPSKINNAYCCQLCPLSFKTEVDLIMHLNSHSQQKKIVCSKCEKLFLGCYFFDTLFAILPCELQYFECNFCKTGYKTQYLLQHHTCSVNNFELDTLKYKCCECNISFEKLHVLLNHQMNVHKKYCMKCNMGFLSYENLQIHMNMCDNTTNETHKKRQNETGRSKPVKIADSRLRNISETYSCSSTSSGGASSQHVDAVKPCSVLLDPSEVSQYFCPETRLYNYSSEIEEELPATKRSRDHKISSHARHSSNAREMNSTKSQEKTRPSTAGANKLFACKHCNKTFNFKIYLYRHIAIAHKHILTKYTLSQ